MLIWVLNYVVLFIWLLILIYVLIQRNEVTVASILGGAADNTGLSISRRLVMKTGLHIVLACNIPKNCPIIEADAERLLLQKLKSLRYIKPNSGSAASDL